MHGTLAERSLEDAEPVFRAAGAVRRDIVRHTRKRHPQGHCYGSVVPCGFIAVCRQDFNYHILRGVIISTTGSAEILKPIDGPDGADPWDGDLMHQQVCPSRLPGALPTLQGWRE